MPEMVRKMERLWEFSRFFYKRVGEETDAIYMVGCVDGTSCARVQPIEIEYANRVRQQSPERFDRRND